MARANDLGELIAGLQRAARRALLPLFFVFGAGVVLQVFVLASSPFMALIYGINALMCLVGWFFSRKREIPETYELPDLVGGLAQAARYALLALFFIFSFGALLYPLVLPPSPGVRTITALDGVAAAVCLVLWLSVRKAGPRRGEP